MTTENVKRPGRAADTVVKHLEQLLLEGTLRPGDALLAERELAERLNVSRPTLRAALKVLTEKGLLKPSPRGTAVAELEMKTITDPLMALLSGHQEIADHYLEFRDIVESSAAAMAAQRANKHDLKRLEMCLKKIEEAHVKGDPADEAEADAELHVAIYESSHNLVLLQIMRSLSGNLRTDVQQNRTRLFSIPYVRELLLDQHRKIAEAILARNPEEARIATHQHLAYLREAAREVRAAERNLDISLRRLEGVGISVPLRK